LWHSPPLFRQHMSGATRAARISSRSNTTRLRRRRPVIVFDAKCVLSSSFTQFIRHKDRRARFRLPAAQSELGNALYVHFGLDPGNRKPASCYRKVKPIFVEASDPDSGWSGRCLVAFRDAIAQCAEAFDKRWITRTPATISPMPRSAKGSSRCPNIAQAISVIRATPAPDHTA
jgi:hypothetical protein